MLQTREHMRQDRPKWSLFAKPSFFVPEVVYRVVSAGMQIIHRAENCH